MTTAPPAPTSWGGTGVSVPEIARHLAEQRHPGDGGPSFTLSGVLNLVACATGAADMEEIGAIIDGLGDHRPSRTVLLCPGDAGEGIDATVRTSCRAAGTQSRVAIETVRLTLRGEAREGAASVAVPLLRSDLPTVLWWPWAPDTRDSLRSLASIADRVVTEAGRVTDAAGAIRALAAWVPEADQPVTDLSWAAITGWRQLVAQMLDGAPLGAAREGGATAVVAHGAGDPPPDALLLAGWLRDLIGPGLSVRLEPRDDGDGPGVAAVTLEGGHGRHLVVERAPGRAAAAVSVTEPGGAGRRRFLALPRPDRGRLLAGELELQRRDHAFERALAGACAAGVA